jgi:hypothetical protein
MGIDQIRALKMAADAKTEQPGIRARSDKQKIIMKILSVIYPAYLKLFPICKIKSPVCTGKATCVNHIAGRGTNEVLNMATWESSCEACNGYIEQYDAWARQNGHKISRHTKN